MAATVRINLVRADVKSEFGNELPVASSRIEDGETITSSGTSQSTTITGNVGDIWDIVASGGAVWLKSGASPTAAADDEWLLLDGERIQLGVAVATEKMAVIDA